ncbi:2-aminoethylphosphonate--pyruvate transaminase-like [Saccostrea echinata]|uniref:2-aminoethylphosphonate--pyruvate transaminase-like n=1 Tax=Saccostrea echinata TaxID=191078 RepID=UPI002A7F5924|nr:2-aminoethylphosphonate--pyruvate transaminase-like [Saccostrea echinata]
MSVVQSCCSRIPSIARNVSVFRVSPSRLLSSTSVIFSSHGKEKKLFTPGPLSVSLTVRQAALRDLGSRDIEFISTVKFLRSKLVQIAGVSENDFTAVPVQGSGTFAVEAVFHTAVPKPNGKALILENGAYGKRMGKICEILGVPYRLEGFAENSMVDVKKVEQILREDPSFSMVAVVHCETSSGVINPVEEVGQMVKKHLPNCVYFVDAMSSFGAVPLDLEKARVDFLVSSVNKCLQGIPGFSYAIARTEQLLQCKGNSGSLCLDLYDQYDGLEKTGQFRFTPPTHCMLAFCQAIKEFEEEGGIDGRADRYKENRRILQEGMKKLGFEEFLGPEHKGYIITSYKFPKDPHFDFKTFYSKLNEKGLVIYPGKVLNADCFRIGTIGQLFPEDFHTLLGCIEEVCREMNIKLPVS